METESVVADNVGERRLQRVGSGTQLMHGSHLTGLSLPQPCQGASCHAGSPVERSPGGSRGPSPLTGVTPIRFSSGSQTTTGHKPASPWASRILTAGTTGPSASASSWATAGATCLVWSWAVSWPPGSCPSREPPSGPCRGRG